MKNIIYKVIVLFIIFAAIIAGVIFFNREKNDKADIIMGEPSLPTLSLLASAGEGAENSLEVNELFGYKTQMETKYMRDTITPISSERMLTVKVKNYENYIMGASFELRSQDCERLVERTDVADENIVREEEYTNINITFDNMIDDDREYYLVICLHTDRTENVYFYTRIIKLTSNYCKEDIEFVSAFSDATFTKESEKIISYIEPDPSADNTNFGHVTIHSSYGQITWGELAPEKMTTPVINIKEILKDISCYELTYKVKAKNEYDIMQYYNIREYFRIKWTETGIFLLDYDRKMNQIFDATSQNISAVRINLGICEDEMAEYMASDNNSYIAFAQKNGLWLMDIKHNQVKSLFAFEKPEDDDRRNVNVNSNIQIVSVDDDGSMEFIVYGYMNRGEHEGMVGVSLYSYDVEKNVVNEKIFIPFTRQFGILSEMIGNLFYVNENDIMYIMLSDSVYSVDLTGSEYVQVISGLAKGGFATNQAGSKIAWEDEMGKDGAVGIRIFNLDDGTEKVIQPEEGQTLRVVGFIDEDFAYGVADQSDIVTDIRGNVTIPMNKIVIVDESDEILKEYSKEGYYFTDTEIEKNMISITRARKSENEYVKADNYQIFGNEEEETNIVSVSTITTDKKNKEIVIDFAKKVTTSNTFKNVYPNEIVFTGTNSLSIHELISAGDRYYVYGKGEIRLITFSMADALNSAYECAGVVTDDSGNYVWERISRPENYEISDSKITFDGIMENIQNDLTGCSLDVMYYFIWNDIPVVVMTGSSDYTIIAGYDFYNVILVNPQTKERYKQGQEEAAEMFGQAGNKFMLPG